MKNSQHYQVLARKYRPKSFDSLVGQEPLVRTLTNAIKMDRLAHAFLLTGIRGVGKTTTARIIAKSINCTDLDKSAAIIEPCNKCANCEAFMGDKHPDIIEMDAASRTGINDVREIIENANYLPLLAKFKVYIIDEVHMLSNNAFNALLKTLEEPPAHVKFIFATTELKKIPITVLSRCQRFDLRRLSNQDLIDHLANIAKLENINVDSEALTLIANHSEGSVRDSLSLFDQAIAHSFEENTQKVTADIVRNMLGISSKAKIYDLFELITKGEIAGAITNLRDLYNEGADPITLVEELLSITHFVNKVKLLPSLLQAKTIAESEAIRASSLAEQLDIAYLSSLWQMLLKGLQEIRLAPNTINAAEMLLIRLAYSANLPSPYDLYKQLKKDGSSTVITNNNITSKPLAPAPIEAVKPEAESININSFKQLVQLFADKSEMLLHNYLIEDIHLVSFEPGKIEFRPGENAPKDLANKMAQLLQQWTNMRWIVAISNQQGQASLQQQHDQQIDAIKKLAAKDEIVEAVIENFPGSTIMSVRDLEDITKIKGAK